jgi:uncharacterized membrane protein YbhN (UPF0104 family)
MKLNKKLIRSVLAGLVICATIGVFIYYISHHPEVVHQLTPLPITTLFLLLGLYLVFMLTLAWIQSATLKLCDITLDTKESTLLVAYNSIINFFGPLQSGPAFRAAYLKKRHNVNLKQYAVATLLYYAFFAGCSLLFIATAFIGIWALLLIVIAILAVPLALRSQKVVSIIPEKFRKLKLQSVGQLAAATLAQVSVMAVIFFVELNSLGMSVKAIPALIYTGAANFALFVSITPGAIGFREAFLVFTTSLHHIGHSQIVTASLIDRGVYILLLGILAIFVFGLHAGDYLKKK